jgi:hypothetical protein
MTTPTQSPPETPPAQSVEQRFRQFEAIWRAETGHLSSYTKRFNHPAFQEIIRLGEPVVPLMLRDLAQQPGLWVWALPVITGANPVADADAGKIARMSEAWLRWGREKGYRRSSGWSACFPGQGKKGGEGRGDQSGTTLPADQVTMLGSADTSRHCPGRQGQEKVT